MVLLIKHQNEIVPYSHTTSRSAIVAIDNDKLFLLNNFMYFLLLFRRQLSWRGPPAAWLG